MQQVSEVESRFEKNKPRKPFITKTHKRITIFIFLIALATLLLSKIGIFNPAIAATVNGTNIYLSEVDKQYNSYIDSQVKKPNLVSNEENQIKSNILDRLIDNEIIKQAANKVKITINKQEINNELKSKIDKFTSEKLKNAYKQTSWTKDDLAIYAKAQLVQRKLRQKGGFKNTSNYLYEFKMKSKIKILIAELDKPQDKVPIIAPVTRKSNLKD